MIGFFRLVGLAVAILLIPHGLWGQLTPAEKIPWVGDTPASAPPLATDLSPQLTRKNVSHAIEKVADWQLTKAEPGFNQDWTFAAMYTGFMAVPKAANGKKYQRAMLAMSKKFNWQPGPRIANADDGAIGQTYLDLYFLHHDPAMIAPIRERMDAVMALPDDPEKPLWWWCDALFMAPPVLAKLSRATGDRKYLDFMDREWWITSHLLYSPSNHLFFRDQSSLDKHQANGSSIFWSRGNGWVLAGLARCWPRCRRTIRGAPSTWINLKKWRRRLLRCKAPTDFGGRDCWTRPRIHCRKIPVPPFSPTALLMESTPGFCRGQNIFPWCRKRGRACCRTSTRTGDSGLSSRWGPLPAITRPLQAMFSVREPSCWRGQKCTV
jgi:hypothetical protein